MWPNEEPKTPNYEFDQQNPYFEAENAFEIAQEFVCSGQINQAILALEAVVVRDSGASEA